MNWTVLNLGYNRSWKFCQIISVSFVVVFNMLLSLKPPSPAASTVSMLNDDTTDLIERLADVQQEKWLLEEKVLACENIRFSSLFAAVDVSCGGTSTTQRQKFHTDDVISMEFLSLSRRRSSARNVPSGEERGETDVFAGKEGTNYSDNRKRISTSFH